jgi:hypothetical protein
VVILDLKDERGRIGFSSTTVACIYSQEDAMVDLPDVIRLDQLWKQIITPEIERIVHEELGDATDSKFITFHDMGTSDPQRFLTKRITLESD